MSSIVFPWRIDLRHFCFERHIAGLKGIEAAMCPEFCYHFSEIAGNVVMFSYKF